jgi:hypothetical protein
VQDLKEKSKCRKLKKEAPDRTHGKTLLRKDYGPVVRETTEWMNESRQPDLTCRSSVLFNDAVSCYDYVESVTNLKE